jgi:hypothetical protein
MSQEAKVKVRIDTAQAKTQLAGLAREGMSVAGKVSSNLRSVVGRGLGATGLGVGIGAGIAAVRGPTESGLTSVVGEALGPLGFAVEKFFLGDLGIDARAKATTRQEAIATFSQAAGAMNGGAGGLPPGVKEWFASVETINRQKEVGREVFMKDSDFHGPGIEEIIKTVMGNIKQLLFDAVDYLLGKTPTVSSK